MKTRIRTRFFRFAPLLALAAVAGCADLTVDGGVDTVTGLTITDTGGNTLVTVNSANAVNGSLSIARNAQRPLVVLLRGTGSGVVVPGLGQSIRITITNPQVASWTETGAGTGTLRGGAATGQTTMRVDLIDAGTVEYSSPLIPIQVT